MKQMGGYVETRQMGSYTSTKQMGDVFTSSHDGEENEKQMGVNDPVAKTPDLNFSTHQQKPYTEADRIRDEQARQMGCDL